MNRLLSHRLQVPLNVNQISYFGRSALSIQLRCQVSAPPHLSCCLLLAALHFSPTYGCNDRYNLKKNLNVLAIPSQARACEQTPLTRANMVILLE